MNRHDTLLHYLNCFVIEISVDLGHMLGNIGQEECLALYHRSCDLPGDPQYSVSFP